MDQKKTQLLISGLLLTTLFLSSCDASQAKMDDNATHDAAQVLETKTAAAPSPTPTKKPTATLSPTLTPNPKSQPEGIIAYNALSNPSNPDSYAIYLLDPQMPGDSILLSSYPFGDLYPAWSADGQYVAITSMRYYSDNIDIFLYPVDGTEVIRLTDDLAVDAQSDWSPDNQRVIFVSTRDGNQELYLVDRDGNNIVRLTDDPGIDNDPAWSPDGGQIAFTSQRNGNLDIYLINLDTGELTQLTDKPDDELLPDWSPDGSQIAFSAFMEGNLDLYLMDSDGSDEQRLTFYPQNENNPSWSPGGAFIAFDSNRGGDYNIFMIELATGEEVQLTMDSGDEFNPNWGRTDFDFGTDPWFGYAICVRDVDNDFYPDEPTEVFYTTDLFKYIGFQYRNMQNGMDWGHKVINDNPLKIYANAIWDSGSEGFHVFFPSAMSSEAGPFTVELYIEDELVREITCEVVEP